MSIFEWVFVAFIVYLVYGFIKCEIIVPFLKRRKNRRKHGWIPYRYQNNKESSGQYWDLTHQIYLVHSKTTKIKIIKEPGNLTDAEFLVKQKLILDQIDLSGEIRDLILELSKEPV